MILKNKGVVWFCFLLSSSSKCTREIYMSLVLNLGLRILFFSEECIFYCALAKW